MSSVSPRQAYVGCSFDNGRDGWSYLIVNQDGGFSGRYENMRSSELSQTIRLTGLYHLLLENSGDLVVNELKPFYSDVFDVYYPKWLKNGFRNWKNKQIANAELIRSIKTLMDGRNITFVRVGYEEHKFYLEEVEIYAWGAGGGKSGTFEGRK